MVLAATRRAVYSGGVNEADTDILQHLRNADLFAGLDGALLPWIASRARLRQVPRGAQLFHQGDRNLRAHLCLRGWVRISQTGADGNELVLRFISPGHIFGTVALFTDERHPADARAASDVVEASWSRAELLQLLHQHPAIAINAIRIIGERLQQVQIRLRASVSQSASQRLAQTLLTLARQSGMAAATQWRIPFPLRRKDVADVAGTTIYTASRTLRNWERAGIIAAERRFLTIANRPALERMGQAE